MRRRSLRLLAIPAVIFLLPCIGAGAPAENGTRDALAVRAARVLARAVFETQDLARQMRAETYGSAGVTAREPPVGAPGAEEAASMLATLLSDPEPDLAAIAKAVDEIERRVAELPKRPDAEETLGKAEGPAYAVVVRPEGRWAVDDATLASVWSALGATGLVVVPGQPDAGLERVVEIDIPTWTPPGATTPSWLGEAGAAADPGANRFADDPRLQEAGVIVLRDSRPPFEDLLADVPAWPVAMRRAARDACRGNLAEFAARYGMEITSWDAWEPADTVKTGHPAPLRADLLAWTRRLYAGHRQALIGALREAAPAASVRNAWDASRAWTGPPRSIWEDPFATLSGIIPDGWVLRYGDRNPDLLPATFWNLGFAGRRAEIWEELRARDPATHPLGPAYRHHGALVHVRARADSLQRLAVLAAQGRWMAGLDPRAYHSLPRIPDIAVLLCPRGLEQKPVPVRLWDEIARAQEEVRRLGYEAALLPIEIARTRSPALFAVRSIWLVRAQDLDAEAEGGIASWIESGGILLADGPLGAGIEDRPGAGRKRLLEAIGVYRAGDGWIATEGGSTNLRILERDDDGHPLLVEAGVGSGMVLVSLGPGTELPSSFRARAEELAAEKLSATPARPLPGPGGVKPVLVTVIPRGGPVFLWLGNASPRALLANWSSPLDWSGIRELQGPGRSVELTPPGPKPVLLRPWEAAVFELEAGKTP